MGRDLFQEPPPVDPETALAQAESADSIPIQGKENGEYLTKQGGFRL